MLLELNCTLEDILKLEDEFNELAGAGLVAEGAMDGDVQQVLL